MPPLTGKPSDILLDGEMVPDSAQSQVDAFVKHGSAVVKEKIIRLEDKDDGVRIHFEGGQTRDYDFIASTPFCKLNLREVIDSLGVKVTSNSFCDMIDLTPPASTSVAGVYACGDSMTFMKAWAHASFSGSVAGAMVAIELAQLDVGLSMTAPKH